MTRRIALLAGLAGVAIAAVVASLVIDRGYRVGFDHGYAARRFDETQEAGA